MILNFILLILIINPSKDIFNCNEKELKIAQDSSSTIVCSFYLDEESEIMDNLEITFFLSNEVFITDSKGEILLKNIKPGYYGLSCEKKGVIVIIDSIFLRSPKTRIRLYDYLFDNYKMYIDSANSDIRNRKVRILLSGFMPFYLFELRKIYEIEKKYGFHYGLAGCDPNGVWLYNYKIFKYLDTKNGPNWREEYKKDFEDARKKLK